MNKIFLIYPCITAKWENKIKKKIQCKMQVFYCRQKDTEATNSTQKNKDLFKNV